MVAPACWAVTGQAVLAILAGFSGGQATGACCCLRVLSECSFTARPSCPKCRSERGQDCSLPLASHAGPSRSAPYISSPHSRETSIGSVAVRAESVNPTEVLTRLDFDPGAPKNHRRTALPAHIYHCCFSFATYKAGSCSTPRDMFNSVSHRTLLTSKNIKKNPHCKLNLHTKWAVRRTAPMRIQHPMPRAAHANSCGPCRLKRPSAWRCFRTRGPRRVADEPRPHQSGLLGDRVGRREPGHFAFLSERT